MRRAVPLSIVCDTSAACVHPASFARGRDGSERSFRCCIRRRAFGRAGQSRRLCRRSAGQLIKEASGKNIFHKFALGRRSAFDRYGERKTVISGDSDDLGTLAATAGINGKAPFLALAKVASTNASSSFPLSIHCWHRRWQVWNGGCFSGSSRHCAPVPSTYSTPLSTARVSCQGRPRLSARRAPPSTGSTSSHYSSVNSQRPAMRRSRDHTEQLQN